MWEEGSGTSPCLPSGSVPSLPDDGPEEVGVDTQGARTDGAG